MGLLRFVAVNLLLLNFCMFAIVSSIAGWAINTAIGHRQGFQAPTFANAATEYFVVFTLIAGVVGMASVLASLHHLRAWKHESLGGSTAASWIAWLLTLLAMGLACKEINMGGHRIKRMIAMESFVIILSGTQLLYLLVVSKGIFGGEYERGHRGQPTEEGHKSVV